MSSKRLSRRSLLSMLPALPVLTFLGCSSDSDDGESVESTPAGAAATTPSPQSSGSSSLYFPSPSGEWEQITPEQAGFTTSGIESIVDIARDNRSTTLTMISGGRILAESYFGGTSATTLRDVASVQKSIISTLIGIAVEDGLLSLDDPVSAYLPAGWSNADTSVEASITIRHLMTHSSGLNPRSMTSVAVPGTKFDYNTAAYQRLRPLLEEAAGQEINAITRGWIFDKIGPSDATSWQPRADEGDADGGEGWGLSMTARDMARFGLLAVRRGQWAGTSVVSAAWFDDAWASSAEKADYGLLWWLMGKGRVRGPGVPEDWVAALGARDQKIYVFPSLDLVLIRQGLAAQEETENVSNFDRVLFNAIVAARA